MRLIDADALIMALRLEYPMMPMFKENQKEWEIKTDGYRKAEEVIRNAPTIDAVSVVRCKECKHRKKNGFCLEHNRYEKNDNGYCSYGERREP